MDCPLPGAGIEGGQGPATSDVAPATWPYSRQAGIWVLAGLLLLYLPTYVDLARDLPGAASQGHELIIDTNKKKSNCQIEQLN